MQIERPFREEDFVLFNLDDDLGETTDLSEDAERVHVIPEK